MKRCSKCKVEQPVEEFYRDKKMSGGRGSWCKTCFRAQYAATRERRLARNKERYFADVEASRAADKARRALDKDKLAARHRQRTYGISAEQYAEMVARCKGRCEICEAPPTRQGLCIDHDHTTGAVRGLLCGSCNQALGKLKDDPRIMRAALAYVEQHQTSGSFPEGSPHDGHQQDRCVGNSDNEEGEN
jgi:hypothetical protein